jgi:hypothetical protein
MPPQGLLVIAAYLPASWPIRFIDENITRATAADFDWVDIVLVSGMHIQAPRIHDIAKRAKTGRQSRRTRRRISFRRARALSQIRLSAHW